MRGKSIILIIIALGCGLVASIGISQIMDAKNSGPMLETEKILLPVIEVDVNEPLTPQMFKLEEWPKEKIPKDAIKTLEEIDGLAPRTRLFPDEPVRRARLIDVNDRDAAALRVRPGYRVISVSVTMDSAASGLLHPGDKVDVLVYLRKGVANNTAARTILKNVRVFAINAQTDRESDENGGTIAAKTVSLELKPDQVELTLLASRLGQISLSMRRPDDDEDVATSGATPADIVGSVSTWLKGAGAPNPPKENPLLDLLNQKKEPIAPVKKEKPVWTMDLLGPDGITRWQLDAGSDLPHIVSSPESTANANGNNSGTNEKTEDKNEEDELDADDLGLDDNTDLEELLNADADGNDS